MACGDEDEDEDCEDSDGALLGLRLGTCRTWKELHARLAAEAGARKQRFAHKAIRMYSDARASRGLVVQVKPQLLPPPKRRVCGKTPYLHTREDMARIKQASSVFHSAENKRCLHSSKRSALFESSLRDTTHTTRPKGPLLFFVERDSQEDALFTGLGAAPRVTPTVGRARSTRQTAPYCGFAPESDNCLRQAPTDACCARRRASRALAAAAATTAAAATL